MTPAEARFAVDRAAPKDAMAGWLSAVNGSADPKAAGRMATALLAGITVIGDGVERYPSKLAAAIKVVALLLASEPYGAAEADTPILAETVGLRIAVEVEGFRKALAADQRTARAARLKGGRR